MHPLIKWTIIFSVLIVIGVFSWYALSTTISEEAALLGLGVITVIASSVMWWVRFRM